MKGGVKGKRRERERDHGLFIEKNTEISDTRTRRRSLFYIYKSYFVHTSVRYYILLSTLVKPSLNSTDNTE